MLQPPQLFRSDIVSKPSSTMPLQSLSTPSHSSTPPLVTSHSQPLAGFLSASKKPVRQVYWHAPATQVASAFIS